MGDGNQGNDNLFYSRRIGRQPQGYPGLGIRMVCRCTHIYNNSWGSQINRKNKEWIIAWIRRSNDMPREQAED